MLGRNCFYFWLDVDFDYLRLNGGMIDLLQGDIDEQENG